jgi:hypothetical protein
MLFLLFAEHLPAFVLAIYVEFHVVGNYRYVHKVCISKVFILSNANITMENLCKFVKLKYNRNL